MFCQNKLFNQANSFLMEKKATEIKLMLLVNKNIKILIKKYSNEAINIKLN